MIQTKRFLELVEKNLKDFIEDNTYFNVNREDLEIIQVWYCKTILNHKGLFIIKNTKLGNIYPYFVEATYNGNTNEIYLDLYTKQQKIYVDVNE